MSRQACIKCRTVPASVLVLQCNHNLCIKCSSRICNVDTNSIICPACRVCTYLEEDIVNQIYQFSVGAQQQQVRRGSYLHQSQQTEPSENWKLNHKQSSIPQSYKNSSIKADKSKLVAKHCQQKPFSKKINKQCEAYQSQKYDKPIIYCKEHCQYQIMYICLDCDTCFVCPQCVIHGLHKNHQVETLKKTIVKIQAELSSKIYSLDCSIQGLVQASEDRKKTLRKKIEQINKLKMQAVSKYKLIRDQIAREQAQIMSKCASLVQEFQSDFAQVQSWIKNDLNVIEKEKDTISAILSPRNDKNNVKKQPKFDSRISEIKIVQQYLSHIRKSQKNKSKKFLWINNKQNIELQPEIQQNLQILTDRIQRIKLVSALPNRSQNLNDVQTRNNSLAASRNRNYLSIKSTNTNQNKEPNRQKYWESPFNTLKMSVQKQNGILETQSILVKSSHIRDSMKIRKKSLKSEQENNFLIF